MRNSRLTIDFTGLGHIGLCQDDELVCLSGHRVVTSSTTRPSSGQKLVCLNLSVVPYGPVPAFAPRVTEALVLGCEQTLMR